MRRSARLALAAACLAARGAFAQPLAAPAPSGARPAPLVLTAGVAPAPFARADTVPAAVSPLAPATPPKPRLVWPWTAAGGGFVAGYVVAVALWQARDQEMFIPPQVVVGAAAGAGAVVGAVVGGLVDLGRRAAWRERVRDAQAAGGAPAGDP